jgi:hypothetical protein
MPIQEVVLNKPLSGQEVRDIILSKLKRALDGDTRLADYVAFPAFRYRLDLAILLAGAVHDDVQLTQESGKGPEFTDDGQGVGAVTLHQGQHEMPPNEARVEADLGVPVLGHDEKGRPVEKTVKYGKEQIRRAQGK